MTDSYKIANSVLDLFDLPKAYDIVSIEFNCAKILRYYWCIDDKKSSEIVSDFNKFFLNINGLPVEIRQKLELRVKADLIELNNLIQYYQNLPFMEKLIVGTNKPRKQEEYGHLTFYHRTLKKRQDVLDYMLNDMDDLAIKKSAPGYRSYITETVSTIEKIIDVNSDFPYTDFLVNNYKYEYSIDYEKLDFRKINPLRNKIFLHHFQTDYTKGYTEEAKKEIVEQIEPEKLLNQLLLKAERIPVICERMEIFSELKDLFLQQKWYGFYALAMPQVEGIFAEMVSMTNPESRLSGSLPDKVKLVRPYSETSQFDFDYYEFYLPESRNKFSHTGKDNDIKTKCYYLLMDLTSILTTCEDLNSPIIQLSNMVNDGPDGLRHIGDFAKLLSLIAKTNRSKEFEYLKDKLNDFVYHKIKSHIDLATYIKS